MTYPVANAKIRWLAPDEGGLKLTPYGPVYAANAHFLNDPEDDIFSIVLKYPVRPEGSSLTHDAEFQLLVPDNLPDVVARIKAGAKLLITEGYHPVAECTILSVRFEDGERVS